MNCFDLTFFSELWRRFVKESSIDSPNFFRNGNYLLQYLRADFVGWFHLIVSFDSIKDSFSVIGAKGGGLQYYIMSRRNWVHADV